jgi:hypothetical protein
MVRISHTGPMKPGLVYQTTSVVMGMTNNATVEVVELKPDELIVLASKAGLVGFKGEFELTEAGPNSCTVVCRLDFVFSKAVFNLAQPVVETVAKNRIESDLETLRAILG